MLGDSIEELEAKAILEGIKLVVLNKWQRVIVELDASTVINHLRGFNSSWRVETILSNAIFLAQTVGSISWEYIPIIANQCTY